MSLHVHVSSSGVHVCMHTRAAALQLSSGAGGGRRPHPCRRGAHAQRQALGGGLVEAEVAVAGAAQQRGGRRRSCPGAQGAGLGCGGREEGGARVRAAAAISHQMSPSAAKAAPGADNGRAGQGAGRATRGDLTAAPLLTPTAPRPHWACPLRSHGACCDSPAPLGAWPSCYTLLPRPHPHLLIASSFRTPDRYYLLQEAIPGLPFSGPHSTWLPNLHVCPGATPTPPSSPDFQRYH